MLGRNIRNKKAPLNCTAEERIKRNQAKNLARQTGSGTHSIRTHYPYADLHPSHPISSHEFANIHAQPDCAFAKSNSPACHGRLLPSKPSLSMVAATRGYGGRISKRPNKRLRTLARPSAGFSAPGAQYALSNSPYSRACWILQKCRTKYFSAIIVFVFGWVKRLS